MIFPWAVVPFSYCFSYIYTKESTAQTFTIYQNILLGSIGSIVTFALRMVEGTALWGDRVMWAMRFTSPAFGLCNSIIYSAEKVFMYKQRDENRMDIDWRYPGREELLPNPIEHEDVLHLTSLGGDFLVLGLHAVFWTVLFIYIESRPDGELEKMFSFTNRFGLPSKKSNEELQLDQDVMDEEKRIQNGEVKDSLVSADKFRKVYRVPFGKPILAVEKASFTVRPGECFALLGINGAGKSTTFKSLTNEILPTEGTITVTGKDVTKEFETIRHKLGYCPQSDALFNGVTVREHLKFYAEIKGIPPPMQDKLV